MAEIHVEDMEGAWWLVTGDAAYDAAKVLRLEVLLDDGEPWCAWNASDHVVNVIKLSQARYSVKTFSADGKLEGEG